MCAPHSSGRSTSRAPCYRGIQSHVRGHTQVAAIVTSCRCGVVKLAPCFDGRTRVTRGGPVSTNPTPGRGEDGIHSQGAYQVMQSTFVLRFPEPNAVAMIHFSERHLRIVEPVRFIDRASQWTGTGTQSPPKVSGTLLGTGETINPRRHGSFYPLGQFRAYQIDLGRHFEPGEEILVKTETKYIDERST